MCGGGGAVKKAARIQAQATLDAANAAAKQARLQAQAAQQQMESSIARDQVTAQAKAAAQNQTVDQVNVDQTTPDNSVGIVDPNTGKKRAPRDAFRVSTPSSAGINI